ncbi:hypothetical protein DIPPA_27040 [Diplonema papillatum]|nr:hypothetical protein DIPPA_27040 [Diplonema papillatum]
MLDPAEAGEGYHEATCKYCELGGDQGAMLVCVLCRDALHWNCAGRMGKDDKPLPYWGVFCDECRHRVTAANAPQLSFMSSKPAAPTPPPSATNTLYPLTPVPHPPPPLDPRSKRLSFPIKASAKRKLEDMTPSPQNPNLSKTNSKDDSAPAATAGDRKPETPNHTEAPAPASAPTSAQNPARSREAREVVTPEVPADKASGADTGVVATASPEQGLSGSFLLKPGAACEVYILQTWRPGTIKKTTGRLVSVQYDDGVKQGNARVKPASVRPPPTLSG